MALTRGANSHGKLNTTIEETSRVRSGAWSCSKTSNQRSARDVLQPSYHESGKLGQSPIFLLTRAGCGCRLRAMPRMARAIAVGCAHHITQRGNNRQDVFFVDQDREVYLQILQEQAGKYGLEVLGYCLMTNHVHIVAIPHAEDSLAKGIGRTHVRYSQYINRFHSAPGICGRGDSTPVPSTVGTVAGDEVHRAQSRAGEAVPAGVAVRVVQCGGSYGGGAPDRSC